MNDNAQVGVFTNMSNQEEPVSNITTINKLPPSPEELVRSLPSSLLHEFVAKLCHEVNRSYSLALDEANVLPIWEDLDLDLRLSIVRGVNHVATNDELTARDMHYVWLEDKKNQGWRYGVTKSIEHKTHPNLVPYDQLHQTQQVKDDIFLTICRMFFE